MGKKHDSQYANFGWLQDAPLFDENSIIFSNAQ